MEFKGSWINLTKALTNAFPQHKFDFLVVSSNWLEIELRYYNNNPILRKRDEELVRVNNSFVSSYLHSSDMAANAYALANLLTGKENKFPAPISFANKWDKRTDGYYLIAVDKGNQILEKVSQYVMSFEEFEKTPDAKEGSYEAYINCSYSDYRNNPKGHELNKMLLDVTYERVKSFLKDGKLKLIPGFALEAEDNVWLKSKLTNLEFAKFFLAAPHNRCSFRDRVDHMYSEYKKFVDSGDLPKEVIAEYFLKFKSVLGEKREFSNWDKNTLTHDEKEALAPYYLEMSDVVEPDVTNTEIFNSLSENLKQYKEYDVFWRIGYFNGTDNKMYKNLYESRHILLEVLAEVFGVRKVSHEVSLGSNEYLYVFEAKEKRDTSYDPEDGLNSKFLQEKFLEIASLVIAHADLRKNMNTKYLVKHYVSLKEEEFMKKNSPMIDGPKPKVRKF